MNKRIKKKKSLQQIINRIYSISDNNEDVIVMEYDPKTTDFENLDRIYSGIKMHFKNKNMIAIPKGIELKQYKKCELYEMIRLIEDVLNSK